MNLDLLEELINSILYIAGVDDKDEAFMRIYLHGILVLGYETGYEAGKVTILNRLRRPYIDAYVD